VLVCLTGFDVDAVGFLSRVSGVQRGLVLGDPGGHGGNAEEVIVIGEELWALEDIVQFGIHQGCIMVERSREPQRGGSDNGGADVGPCTVKLPLAFDLKNFQYNYYQLAYALLPVVLLPLLPPSDAYYVKISNS
jgi:hypothetical protein